MDINELSGWGISQQIAEIVENGFTFDEETGEVFFTTDDLEALQEALDNKLESLAGIYQMYVSKGEALKIRSKDISNNYNFLEQIREQALSKLKYENMDMDSLIYEFLKRIEIYHTDEEDTIKLKIILNTGNDFGINFKHNKHHFSTNHSYD